MLEKLENRLMELGKVAIAYSGGIDSTFLLYMANKVLAKENVIAIIANGCMMPTKDYQEAINFLKENNFDYKEFTYKPLDIIEFKENHKDRCYYCKKNLMTKIIEIGNQLGFNYILDGKNSDDLNVYRPGNTAIEELQIISPLSENNFNKEMIRKYSRKFGIKIWNTPSNSCLATRFPYNTILTEENLKKVEISEELLKKLEIPKVRVRVHESIAKIEVEKKYFETILKNEQTIKQIKELGFNFVVLDLLGLKNGAFD